MRSPSPEIEEETSEQIEQHGAEPQTASYNIKHPRGKENLGHERCPTPITCC